MPTDPFRYFRIEARELADGLSRGVLELDKGACDPVVVARLLRLAHTLKGAARVVKQLEIAEASHHLEEILTPLRESTQLLGSAQLEPLIALVDGIESALGALEKTTETNANANAPRPALPTDTRSTATPAGESIAALAPSAALPSGTPEEAIQTVRVDVSEVDQLQTVLTSSGTELTALKKQVADLKRVAGIANSLSSRLNQTRRENADPYGQTEQELSGELSKELERATQNLLSGVARLERELASARQEADRLRLVPVQTLEIPLSRAARDAARALGKNVEFILEGGNLRLDSKVLVPLKNALGHVVRNAVAHGIESPDKRQILGKPLRGTIRLVVSNQGKYVMCVCSDDGSGVDEQAVRRSMIQRGSLSPDESLSSEMLFERMLSGGVSTSTEVTQISGRGIGLDVIRETAERLEGVVTLESQKGCGTKVSFKVPMSLASLPALLVEASGMTVAIPLGAVLEARRFARHEIQRTAQGTSVDIAGKLVPYLPLARALRTEEAPAEKHAVSSVVLLSEGKMAAFGIDILQGTADIVVRPLPLGLNSEPTVGGMSMDAAGNPRLVLDPAALIAATGVEWLSERETRTLLAPVLVIDDSLTTRMLEQSILESAGYVVELATSGEEGIEKARAKKYSIFLVDVDMPGMSGFDFVTQTRADSELRETPAILVTSRSSPEDFEKGRKAGAGGYVVKGEFDQNQLLQSIERLLSP